MFFKKKKAPPQKAAEPAPFYQACRKLDIATPKDFGHLHEEYYGGLFCKIPWVRVSFSVPDSDWSEFQKSSHFQSLVSFLEELSKRNPLSQPNISEESATVSDVDVLKRNIDKELRKNRQYVDEKVRRLEHKYYQLCEDFKFKSRLYAITFCGLIVSVIGLLIRIIIMSN